MGTAELVLSNWTNSGNAVSEDHRDVSDEQLVAAAKNGDSGSFDALCKRHSKKIFRATHNITRNRADAEDAVQECFLNAFIHLRSFDGRSRFSTWLTRIAINAALMKMRKHRVRREVPSEEADAPGELGTEARLPDPAPNPEERYAKSEQAAMLRGAIANLRPTSREVVEILLQDYSMSETARILRVSTAAVKARLYHARTALRHGFRLHLIVPAGWTDQERSLRAIGRAFRQGQRRKETQSSAGALELKKFVVTEMNS